MKFIASIITVLMISPLMAQSSVLEDLKKTQFSRHKARSRVFPMQKYIKLKGVRAYIDADDSQTTMGFQLTNKGSNDINPLGDGQNGHQREFDFKNHDRAVDSTYLFITDNTHFTGRMSHDLNHTEIHFLPRKQVSTFEILENSYLVTLPTGEPVFFDKETLEIIDGVLDESPIDFNQNRHARKMPQIEYKGKGVAIVLKQRGTSPRTDLAFGSIPKKATLYFQGQSCRVKPSQFFSHERADDGDLELDPIYSEDAPMLKKIEALCRWDLSSLY